MKLNMKLIEFKEYNNLTGEKKLNKRKIFLLILASVLILITTTFFLIYFNNSDFRNWADIHILMKTVSQGNLPRC